MRYWGEVFGYVVAADVLLIAWLARKAIRERRQAAADLRMKRHVEDL